MQGFLFALLTAFLSNVLAEDNGAMQIEVDSKGMHHTRVTRKEHAVNHAHAKMVIDGDGNLAEDERDTSNNEDRDGKEQNNSASSKATVLESETVNRTVAHLMRKKDDKTGDDDPALDQLEAMMLAEARENDDFSIIPWLRRRKTETTTAPPPPIDCKWADWEEERPCSQTCGGGMLPKTRRREVTAAYGGRECQGRDWKIDECKNDACPTTAAPTTPAPTTMPYNSGRQNDVSMLLFSCLWIVTCFTSH